MGESFGSNLKDFILSNKIQIDRIEYWGGEPCLYFDQIQAIEELFPNNKRPSRFVTNGSLLTHEMVDYINQRNMYVNLSYHEGQLDEKGWETALFLKNLHVTSLIHSKCLSWEPYFQKWNWVHKTFGRYIPWYIFNLYNTEGVQEYCLSKSDIDTYIKYLYSIIPLIKTNAFYSKAFEALISTELGKKYTYNCACFNPEILSIDTRGNQYICHHACSKDYKIGNIFTDGLNKISLNTLKPKCYDCKLLSQCGGGCMREINDSSCYFLHKLDKLYNDIKDSSNEI